jgi:hypothetical protein
MASVRPLRDIEQKLATHLPAPVSQERGSRIKSGMTKRWAVSRPTKQKR